jgi:prepilin-type N-terminal cleavage/methylation domain-containing protein
MPTLRRGFTLIELLVVISILAVLASLLLPAITTVRTIAKKAQCASRLRQLGMACFAYQGDYGVLPQRSKVDYFDTWFPHFIDRMNLPGQDPEQRMSKLILEYTGGSKRVFYCPANSQGRDETIRWPLAVDQSVSSTYQFSFWVSGSQWLIPKYNVRNPDSTNILACDVSASRDFSGLNPVIWNHKVGNGVAGMNRLFGDGSVRWANTSGTWETWCRDPTSRYYWRWIQ